ncbi:hypothetical protein SAMN05216428_102448 [Nitrosospira sp. Nsp11]|uniref:hypothetical protein n=1 Tax=Nitrosospira sp. Nsp11 TaxID=1855338 RepID=UPI00091274A3|nr:hypothetical protein [Nitrosospira sp. Nsp11]SHL45248.1 hypothetical protein SAMN05216428_102448 [Nitrosospira sp. Nsp11]
MMSHPEDARCTSTEDVSSEQASDFAALRAAVDEVEPVTVAEQSGPGLADELSGYIMLFVSVAKPALPSLGVIYTGEVVGAAAAAIASVCEKHGWLQGGLGGEYKEEIAAAMVLLPLGYATYRGVKSDIGVKPEKALSVTDSGVVGTGPGPGTVTAGESLKTVTFG